MDGEADGMGWGHRSVACGALCWWTPQHPFVPRTAQPELLDHLDESLLSILEQALKAMDQRLYDRHPKKKIGDGLSQLGNLEEASEEAPWKMDVPVLGVFEDHILDNVQSCSRIIAPVNRGPPHHPSWLRWAPLAGACDMEALGTYSDH